LLPHELAEGVLAGSGRGVQGVWVGWAQHNSWWHNAALWYAHAQAPHGPVMLSCMHRQDVLAAGSPACDQAAGGGLGQLDTHGPLPPVPRCVGMAMDRWCQQRHCCCAAARQGLLCMGMCLPSSSSAGVARSTPNHAWRRSGCGTRRFLFVSCGPQWYGMCAKRHQRPGSWASAECHCGRPSQGCTQSVRLGAAQLLVSGATWHLLLLRVVASVRLVALTLQVRSGMHETYVRGHSSLAKHCLAGKVMTGLAMYSM